MRVENSEPECPSLPVVASDPGVLLGARQAVDQAVLGQGEDGGELAGLSAGAGLSGRLPGDFLSEEFVAGTPRVAPAGIALSSSCSGCLAGGCSFRGAGAGRGVC